MILMMMKRRLKPFFTMIQKPKNKKKLNNKKPDHYRAFLLGFHGHNPAIMDLFVTFKIKR